MRAFFVAASAAACIHVAGAYHCGGVSKASPHAPWALTPGAAPLNIHFVAHSHDDVGFVRWAGRRSRRGRAAVACPPPPFRPFPPGMVMLIRLRARRLLEC